jgi:hypothetical protein
VRDGATAGCQRPAGIIVLRFKRHLPVYDLVCAIMRRARRDQETRIQRTALGYFTFLKAAVLNQLAIQPALTAVADLFAPDIEIRAVCAIARCTLTQTTILKQKRFICRLEIMSIAPESVSWILPPIDTILPEKSDVLRLRKQSNNVNKVVLCISKIECVAISLIVNFTINNKFIIFIIVIIPPL